MYFNSIPGKTLLKNGLIQKVNQGKLPHAQLFIENEGYGGLACALALACYILCDDKSDNEPCGQCIACKKSMKLLHPDLHFVFPVVKKNDKKREDTTSDDFLGPWREMVLSNPYCVMHDWMLKLDSSTSSPNINVKECSEIIRKLSMMPYESDRKVMVLWLPEYLGKEGNRLLKFIEEPTPNTYFIMISQNQNSILQTIVSRCQLINIPPFDIEDITTTLIAQNISHHTAEKYALIAEGNMTYALLLAHHAEKDYSQDFVQWLRIIYKCDPVEIIEWVSAMSTVSKDNILHFMEYGINFVRNLHLLITTHGKISRFSESEKPVVSNMSKIFTAEKALKIYDTLSEIQTSLPRNANIKILLYAQTLQMTRTLRM